jgi:hypothetical protein
MGQASAIAQADAMVEFWAVVAELVGGTFIRYCESTNSASIQYDSITLDLWKKLVGMTAAAALCEYSVHLTQYQSIVSDFGCAAGICQPASQQPPQPLYIRDLHLTFQVSGPCWPQTSVKASWRNCSG